MKSWIVGALALSSVTTLGVACKNSQQQVADQQREVVGKEAQARGEMAEARGEAEEKKAEAESEAQREISDEQRDLAAARQDLGAKKAEAHREAKEKGSATGGMAQAGAAQTVDGSLKSTLGAQVTIQDAQGQEIKLATDDSTRVTHKGVAVNIDDFKEGTVVRASYSVKGDEKVAQEVMIISPVQKQ